MFDLWTIVDTVERPYLVKRLQAGTLYDLTCPVCDKIARSFDVPLLLYRPDVSMPLIFSPSGSKSAAENQQEMEDLINNLKNVLGDAWRDEWASHILWISQEYLPFVADADPDEIPARLEFAAQQKLQHIPFLIEMKKFVLASDPEAAVQIVQKHPELLSIEANQLLERMLIIAREQNQLLIGSSQVDQYTTYLLQMESRKALLRRCREIGIEGVLVEIRHSVVLPFSASYREVVARAQAALERSLENRSLNAIDEAIHAWQQVLNHEDFPSDPDSRRATLNVLSGCLALRFDNTGLTSDLETSIRAFQDLLPYLVENSPEWIWVQGNLGMGLGFRFDRLGHAADLDASIAALKSALSAAGPNFPEGDEWQNKLAATLQLKLRTVKGLSDLDARITTFQQALTQVEAGSPAWAELQGGLGEALYQRVHAKGAVEDIEAAIVSLEQALSRTTPDSTDWVDCVNNLGTLHLRRFEQLGDMVDLDVAITSFQRVLEEMPLDSPDENIVQNNLLGWALYTRYKAKRTVTDLEVAAEAFWRCLAMTSQESPHWAGTQHNLSLILHARFKEYGEEADLTAAVDAIRQAVAVTDIHSEYWTSYLHTLGMALDTRFRALGDVADLEEAIDAFQRELTATSKGTSDWASGQNSLALVLLNRFEALGNHHDLDDAVAAFQNALLVPRKSSPKWALYQTNLGDALLSRYHSTEVLTDLEAAIAAYAKSIAATRAESRDWASRHQDLGQALSLHYRKSGDIADLDAAIIAFLKALMVSQRGSSRWFHLQLTLIEHLNTHFEKTGSVHDLDAIIDRCTKTLSEMQPESTKQDLMNWHLSTSLRLRAKIQTTTKDLDMAITCCEQMLNRLPEGSPRWIDWQIALGSSWLERFGMEGQESDLMTSSIVYERVLKNSGEYTPLSRNSKAILLRDLLRLCITLDAQGKHVRAGLVEMVALEAFSGIEDGGLRLIWYELAIRSHYLAGDLIMVDKLARTVASTIAAGSETDFPNPSLDNHTVQKNKFMELNNQEIQVYKFVDMFLNYGIPDVLQTFLSTLLEGFQRTRVPHTAAKILNAVGDDLYANKHDLALPYLEASVQLARQSADPEVLVSALTTLGGYYNDVVGDSEAGLAVTFEAIAVADAHKCRNDTKAIFDAGNILLNLGRGVEAESYLRDALALGKQRGKYNVVVHALRALARQFKNHGLLPDAEELLREAVSIGRREKETYATMFALGEFCSLLEVNNAAHEALNVSQEFLELAKELKIEHEMEWALKKSNDLQLILSGEWASFQMMSKGKWIDVTIPVPPELLDLVHETESYVYLWSLVKGALGHGEQSDKISNLLELRNRISQQADPHTAIEMHVQLSQELINFIYNAQGWVGEEVLTLLAENNQMLRVLLPDMESELQADVWYYLALEQMIHRITIPSQLFRISVDPDADTEREMIWMGFQALEEKQDSPVAGKLLQLAGRLLRAQALLLLDAIAGNPAMHSWQQTLFLILEGASLITPEEALPVLESMLNEGKVAKDHARHINILFRLIDVNVQLGRTNEAKQYCEELLSQTDAPDYVAERISVYDWLGILHRQAGDYRRALECYDTAITLIQQHENQSERAQVFHHKGNVLFDLMDYPGALAYFYTALDIYMRTEDTRHIAMIFDNIANVASQQGNKDEIWYRRRAVDLAIWSNDPGTQALCRFHLGTSLHHAQEFDKAKSQLDLALTLYRELGEQNRAVMVMLALGRWYQNEANPQHSTAEALSLFQEVLTLAQSLQLPLQEADSLVDIARLVQPQDPSTALAHLDHALALYAEIPHYRDLVDTMRLKAHYLVREQPVTAFELLLKSLGIIESIRRTYTTRADYLAFLAEDYAEIGEESAVLAGLMSLKEQALPLAECAKAVTLREQLARRWRTLSDDTLIPQELLTSEEDELQHLTEMEVSSLFATGVHAIERDQAYRKSIAELQNIWDEIAQTDHEYVEIRRAEVIDNAQAMSLLQRLEHPTSLVEFIFSVNYRTGLAVIVDPVQGVTVQTINLGLTMLLRAQKQLEQELIDVAANGSTVETWHQALQPLADAIVSVVPPGRSLIIVPHRRMYHLPLHALPIGEGRLIDRYPITYLPTASMLRFRRKQRTTNNALVVGAVFEKEAQHVAQQLDATTFLGPEAREEAVHAAMPHHDVIHFSCHSIFDPQYPHLSGLQLAHDEVLTADAVLQMPLSASLVVLSACQTGRMQVKPGDELEGLLQAFLLAGVETVVSTLWMVDSRATAKFMEYFYQSLLRENQSVGRSLRAAQLRLRAEPEWSHPYYWAGFIATGLS